jgi:hypothetical protein
MSFRAIAGAVQTEFGMFLIHLSVIHLSVIHLSVNQVLRGTA